METEPRLSTPDSPLSVDLGADDALAVAEGDDVSTLIVFDWDDTLLSSSWLAHNGLRLDEPAVVPPEAAEQLDVLQDSVIALMERAVKSGPVVIITNAENGWVELSCKKFMPRVFPLLASVKILSARSTFEALYPDSPADWKEQAFYQEICMTYAPKRVASVRNILSFGDSIHERAAIHKVTSNMRNTRTKSIKFVDRPTVEQLKRQVDLVCSCLGELVLHPGSLDLMLTISLLFSSSA